MKIGLRNVVVVWGMLLLGFSALAQTDYNVDGEVQDAEIIIEKERKIELNKEYKLYEFIKWKPERTTPASKPSEFKWYVYDVANEPMQFEPAKATIKQKDRSYQHYGKAGFGNYASPILDVSLTSVDDPNQMVGINIKHESFETGAVDDDNSGAAATEVNLYGVLLRETIKLESALNYSLEKNYYYGYPAGTAVNKGDIKHSGNFLNFNLEGSDSRLDDVWGVKAGFNFRHYSDNFNANENTFSFDISGSYTENIFLETEVRLSQYKDTGIDESRSYFRLNPYYRLRIDELKLDVGLSFSIQNDDLPDLSSNKIFPYARASYPLTPDYTVFAQLDGGYTFNSLYDFASEVGVLNQSVGVANSERLFDLSGGIAGNPMEKLSLEACVSFQSVKYLPIMVNSIADLSRIDMSFEQEVSNILTFGATGQYEINESHEVSVGLNLYSYHSKGYDQIYHRPTSVIQISGDHQFVPKLNVNWNFTFMRGIVGLDQNLTDFDVKLDAISKLDVSLHYQLKEAWGIFLSGENLINKNYSRYLYYPQRGIQIKAGVTFRL
ncbi:hypothetical protein SAMN04488029_3949 [Reichenbachiella faecimaris]|uniref:Uncharacterized protein n=2 Tax=Reichenbachiella faecimaris TaxID=692418 RepID=A0A1W2GRD3_REIFA|nr:hypothetical protein SAMN04488029_3949 [Reichenbachiella faecimaris]